MNKSKIIVIVVKKVHPGTKKKPFSLNRSDFIIVITSINRYSIKIK